MGKGIKYGICLTAIYILGKMPLINAGGATWSQKCDTTPNQTHVSYFAVLDTVHRTHVDTTTFSTPPIIIPQDGTICKKYDFKKLKAYEQYYQNRQR